MLAQTSLLIRNQYWAGFPQNPVNIHKIDPQHVLASVQPGGGDESIDRRSRRDAVSQLSGDETAELSVPAVPISPPPLPWIPRALASAANDAHVETNAAETFAAQHHMKKARQKKRQ